MSDEYPKLNSYASKRFNVIIAEGFYLFGKNWLTLILPIGLFFIVSLIIKNLIIVELEWQLITMTPAIGVILEGDPTLLTPAEFELLFRFMVVGLSSIFLDSLISTVFTVIPLCLVSNYLYNKFIGRETSLISELKRALNGRFLLVLLLLGVAFSVGWLLFIPGIILFGFYIFYIFTYHSEDSEHPIKDARRVAKGEFWKIIGTFIFYNLIIVVCDTIYRIIIENFVDFYDPLFYNPLTRDYGVIILYDFIHSIVPFLFSPLLICLLTSLYVNLKKKKEQSLLYKSSYQEVPQSYKATHYEAVSGSGIYCPFCGNFMRTKFDFCLHCGESLNFEIE